LRGGLGLLIVFFILLTSGLSSAENTPIPQSIQWQSYSNTPFEQAKKSNQYILLYGKSKSCHWCQEMDKTTWKNPDIIQTIKTSFIPLLIDVDSQLNLAAKYQITSLPTTMILDYNNRIIKIFAGYFTPEFMEESLNKIIHDKPVSSNQPEIIKENQPLVSIALLPTNQYNALQTEQLSIFNKIENNSSSMSQNHSNQEIVDIDSIEYALILSADDGKSAQRWLMASLNAQNIMLDPVWGSMYDVTNGKINYAISTAFLADRLEIYSLAYTYFQDPKYRSIAEKLINYINIFLTSPDGAFYAGQEQYAKEESLNYNYYQLDDQHRRLRGIPSVNPHIFANENGLVITALADFYMATNDSSSLDKAVKATHWVVANFSIPGGGYRHEKSENNVIYLDDTLAMGSAFLALYKATQNMDYLNRAIQCARFINMYFKNTNGDFGYISSLYLINNPNEKIELNAKQNADIVRFTSLLFSYTGDKSFQGMQQNAFKYLLNSSVIAKSSPATILMAEYRIQNLPIHITIVGSKSDLAAKNLYVTALAHLPIYARIDWWDRAEGPLLKADATYPSTDKSAAYVCHGFQCSFPMYNSQDLLKMLQATSIGEKVIAPLECEIDLDASNPFLSLDISNPDNAEKLLASHNWFFVILSFICIGLLISFTPCVLPLVPIVASIIVGTTIGVKKQKTVFLCLTYVLAMSLTYAVVGLLAAVFGYYIQIYMQSKIVLIAFSLIFLFLSLTMLGNYEMNLPNSWQQKISHWNSLQEGGNFFGVMIMGILSSLIVSPCVSAPLVGILSFIAKTSDYILGAVSLFFMSFGMGIPLLIISLFSKNILPKASKWNSQIQNFFGLVLLGISIWIFSRLIPDKFSMILWSAFIVLTSLYIGLTKRSIKSIFNKLLKTFTILLCIYGISLFMYALFMNTELYQTLNKNLKLSVQDQSAYGIPIFKTIKNIGDLEQAIHDVQGNHMPILLDFTAKWCSACVSMDHAVLNNPEVMPLLKEFKLLRVDLTNIDCDNMDLVRKFNVIGPPIIVFFDSQGKIMNLRATGSIDVTQFKIILQKVLDIRYK
jgi:thiol:disulfide interchange protein